MFASSLAGAVTKEQAVKAGIVYNITKFVVWPSNVSDQFNLCVFGDDGLNGGLEALYGKKVNGKPIVLRRDIDRNSAKECQLAFFAKDNSSNDSEILEQLKHLPVLTVSDKPQFIDDGGMVGLIRDKRRVSFEFDLLAVRAAGLNVSAQLLKLAKRVKGLK